MPKCPTGGNKFTESRETFFLEIENEDDEGHFFDNKGVIHKEFMDSGTTINAAYYYNIMDWLVNQNSTGLAWNVGVMQFLLAP